MKKQIILTIVLFLSLSTLSLTPKEIINLSETKYNGELSSYVEMTMQIVRPRYTRSIAVKNWLAKENGTQKSLALITSPAKEKGQCFLKDGSQLWNWNPTIRRLIKLPPSMMSQGWMGSDVSNDEILKEFSLEVDYTHRLIGEEVIDNYSCYHIELLPKEEADVTWGKIEMWIAKEAYYQMKACYYDEEMYLVKTHKASKITDFDGRKLPAVLEILPAEDPDNKTIMTIHKMTFNQKVKERFFTQQNMKRVK